MEELRKQRIRFLAAGLSLFARSVSTEAGRALLQARLVELEREAGDSPEPTVRFVIRELRKRLDQIAVAETPPLQDRARSQRLKALFRAIAAGTTQISVWQALQKERSWQHARKNRLIRIAAIKAEVLDRKLRAASHLEDDSEDDEAMDSGVWRKNYRLEEVQKHPPGTWRCTWCGNANAPSTTECTYYHHKLKKRCEGSQAKTWGGYVEPPTSKYAYNPPKPCLPRRPPSSRGCHGAAAQGTH